VVYLPISFVASKVQQKNFVPMALKRKRPSLTVISYCGFVCVKLNCFCFFILSLFQPSKTNVFKATPRSLSKPINSSKPTTTTIVSKG
jgi:hypothetical protein